MTWPYRDELDEAARAAANAVESVRQSIAYGVLLQEPEMNGAIAHALDVTFRSPSRSGIFWKCRHLRSAGPTREESITGADLIISIDIDLPEFKETKGLMIQNKRDGTNYRKNLLEQVAQMEKHTTSAWLCVLSGTQIRFDSALTVKGRSGRYSRDLARIPPYTFFRDFFQCKIGDHSLDSRKTEAIFSESDGVGLHAVILKGSKG